MAETFRVGFIGLGDMGLPMAQRVLQAGFPLVTMAHRRKERAEQLAGLGAQVVSTPAEVASGSDVIITILPADRELEAVVQGPQGLLQSDFKGKFLLDMTTATADTLLKMEGAVRQAGGQVLDAPVSGGTTGAAAGTLTIMVGGDAGLLETVRPILSAMGTNILHVGALGQGKVVKAVNQMMAAVHLLILGEAFALGVRNGADPETMYSVIKDSSGYSRMMDLRLKQFLLTGSYNPGFKLDLMKKDLQLGLEMARAQGVPVMLSSLAAQVFAAASTAGHGDADFSRAAQFLAELSGAPLGSPGKKS